jgi:glucosamine-6-phosphate deaminase
MNVRIHANKTELGETAAERAIRAIARAIEVRGEAVIILATGTSQFETLQALTRAEHVDWGRVAMYHLDEYIGISPDHGASFRRYLNERFVQRVGPLKEVNFIQGETEHPDSECERIGALIGRHEVDVALVGIGENGHLAFNDPPADFETEAPFIVVRLDEVCRKQQLGEGWFDSMEDVPLSAISMSIRQIMKSRCIIASVPDARKAEAVKHALEGPLTPDCPSSILQAHPDCNLYLDRDSSSLLSGNYR